MGMALGATLIIGVMAREHGGLVEATVIAGGLLVLSLVLPRSSAMVAGAALIGFGAGLVFAASPADEPARMSQRSLPEEVVGTIQSDPRLSAGGYSASLAWRDQDDVSVESLILYSTAVDAGRGDKVSVRGELLAGTEDVVIVDQIDVLESAGWLERMRRTIRSSAGSKILQRAPGSNGSLALGLIIGDDSGLTAAERDSLRASGLSHITAVSGSNVGLVIVAVAFLLRALNRRGWLWLTIQMLGVVSYAWIVGADPPIIRAAIMGSLALFAYTIGRPSHLYTLLFIAGGVMCLADPAVLGSLAFQLSFMSTIGLALAGNLISSASGTWRKVATALLSPAAAAMATAPLLAGTFGTVSPGTIPANVIVAPLIAPSTALAGAVGVIPEGFVTGEAAGLVLWLLTGVVLAISGFVSGMPYAVITFAPLSDGQIVGLYGLLMIVAAPLVPEARLLGFKLKAWAIQAPQVAATSLAAGTAMVGALLFIVD
ncbi:hypothetical protein BH23CHL2_BH23CHL2_19050 [soil metagenome]